MSTKYTLAQLAKINGYELDDFRYSPLEAEARKRADDLERYRRAAAVLIAPHLVEDRRLLVNRVAAFIGAAEEPTLVYSMKGRLGISSYDTRYATSVLLNGFTRNLQPRVKPSLHAQHEPLISKIQAPVSGTTKHNPQRCYDLQVYLPTAVLDWALENPERYPELAQAAQEFSPEPMPTNALNDHSRAYQVSQASTDNL